MIQLFKPRRSELFGYFTNYYKILMIIFIHQLSSKINIDINRGK